METHSRFLAWRIPMDRGAWRVTAHRVAKSQTRLKRQHTHTHTHTMIVTVSVAYPPDRLADWELSWLPLLRVMRECHTASSVAPEKVRIQNMASTKCLSLLPHGQVKKIES